MMKDNRFMQILLNAKATQTASASINILNYNTARAVLEWLEDRVAALEMDESGMAVYPRNITGPEQ